MTERRPDQRMNTWQAVIGKWKQEVIPEEHNTPQQEFNRSLEEIEELRTELDQHDGTPQASLRVGLEAVDVMIRMMGIIDALGMDTERLMDYKVDMIHRKYNPHQNRALRESGMAWDQTMAYQKQAFEENGHDHEL